MAFWWETGTTQPSNVATATQPTEKYWWGEPKTTQVTTTATQIPSETQPSTSELVLKQWDWQVKVQGFLGKVLEYVAYPATAVGMLVYDSLKGTHVPQVATHTTQPITPELAAQIVNTRISGVTPAVEEIKSILPGGETYNKYQSLPWYEKLAYEAPAWALLAASGVSATSTSAKLAPIVEKGGVKGVAALAGQITLAPVVAYERILSEVLDFFPKIIAEQNFIRSVGGKKVIDIVGRDSPQYKAIFNIWRTNAKNPEAALNAFGRQYTTDPVFKDMIDTMRGIKPTPKPSPTGATPQRALALPSPMGVTPTTVTGLAPTVAGVTGQTVTGITPSVTGAVTEGIPMPAEVQQQFLSQAGTWLQQVTEVKPNELHVIGIPDGEAFVRTDSQGNPLVVGTSLMRDNQLTLSTIVAAPDKEIAVAKALIDVGNYIRENNIAFPPRSEMSPEAIKVYDKLTGYTTGTATEFPSTAAMAEWGDVSGIEETLASDPIAQYTVHVGNRKVHLDYFLKNGDWPETFTVKEAAALMQKPVEWVQSKVKKGGIATNRVESAYVLDELAEQFHLSEQDFIRRVEQIYRLKQELVIQERIPKAAEGMPEAGLQVDIFGKTTPVFPEGKAQYATEGMDDYAKLQQMRAEAVKPTASTEIPTTGKIIPETGKPAEVPPTVPPSGIVPPTTPGGKPAKPSFTQRDKIIEQSKAVVERDRPGLFTNIINRIPVLKKIVQFERPGLLMQGDNEKILVAHVAESAVRGDIATKALPTRLSIQGKIKDVFPALVKNKPVINGGKVRIKFTGTTKQRSSITGTFLDIAQNPELYELTAQQKAVLAQLESRNTELLNFIKDNYGVEIGTYPAKEGGAFLSNIDISEDVIEAAGSEMRAIALGRARTRVWPTASERMAFDKTFKPETDIEKLLAGMDSAKGSMSAGETFRTVLDGKTRLEVIAETHPELYKKMMDLRKRLTSLQGSAGRLDAKLDKAVTTFLNSPVEDVDLADIHSALDVKLASGPRKGMNLQNIQKEIDGVRAQIKALRPRWEAANLKGYTFVQQGIYRYFPVEQANLIKELLKVSDNPFLNFIENLRGTVFSGDLSPIIGVQTPVGILADPVGSLIQVAGGIKKAIQSKNPLVSFTVEGLARDIAKDPNEWGQFFSLMGRAPAGTPQEFAGGFLSKMPGFSKFTESIFLIVTRQTYNLYRKTWQSLARAGMSELDAKVSAATIASQVFPLMRPEMLGQSKARHTLLRALPTSYSFIRKPAELYGNAVRGFAKLITGQRVKTEEILALKIILTMAATAIVVSALSQADRARRKGENINQAILDAINPNPDNGKFLSIFIGSTRIPIGGPYRALFRAIYPKKLSGIDVPIPFAGLPAYFWNRLNPFIRTQLDLLQNRDFYGKTIRSGELPSQILQTLLYEFEGALPLAAGSAVEAWRTNMTQEEMLTQVIGQFAGMNVVTSKWYDVQSLRDKYAKSDYGIAYDDLNNVQRDDLMRNHNDLKALYDEAKNELLIRGEDLPRIYAILADEAVSIRDNALSDAAQRLLDGKITKYDYDKTRTYVRAYYSGQRNALWQMKEQLDPVQASQLEDYVNENIKPEDKAIDEYWTYYSELASTAISSDGWDAVNDKLAIFISKYPSTIQKYILDNKNSWIEDLPQPARQVELLRLQGIEDETWWDNYRGETSNNWWETPTTQMPSQGGYWWEKK